MDTWKKVYTSDQIYRAEIVKGVLEENHIRAIVISKKDRMYNYGHYEVHVPIDEILKAIKIIQDEIHF